MISVIDDSPAVDSERAAGSTDPPVAISREHKTDFDRQTEVSFRYYSAFLARPMSASTAARGESP